jgi:hypothetical protein
MAANVEQRDRADNLATRQSHPEVAIASLIEARDVLQVRLGIERDRDVELGLLDRNDDVDTTPSACSGENGTISIIGSGVMS